MLGALGVMKEKDIRNARFSSVLAVCQCNGQKFTDNLLEERVAESKMRRVAAARWDERKRRAQVGWIGDGAVPSGARIGGGVLDSQARSWAATAMAVRWSRRASLECLRTKAELKANAIRRIKVTAARPWLGTDSQVEAAQTVPQSVVAESALDAD